MAVSESMFLFEVILENVTSLVESKSLVVKADFADIFSLDLKDPKQLNIVMPQPPPAPPEPPGKKGKKAKPPKPKKGKGAAVPLPPPEPVIQSGQSILFASSGEILLATMKNNPMSLSLWSKEDDLVYIGCANVTWDQQYFVFLRKICNCEKPAPLSMKNEYNIFNEETAKLMAKVTMQIKLTYLEDKITSQFRTVPNHVSGTKKFMYTGVHSKNTSYMCSLKLSEPIEGEDQDEQVDKNPDETAPHIESTFVREQNVKKGIRYADFKNAPGTNTTFFSDDADYCCVGKADKAPVSTYKAPKVMPDLNYMADYVSNVIRSCNENLRMLTPQLEIKPRHRATDIDRLCGCDQSWPDGKLAENVKSEGLPCALCSEPTKPDDIPHSIQLQNIRGPCGKVECKVAQRLRSYIERLANEDNKEVVINEIVGPCGSRTCTLADRIQKFIRQEGVFSTGQTAEGFPTICACEEKLKQSLDQTYSCDSLCSKDCGSVTNSNCSSKTCVHNDGANNTYCVGYCTIVNNMNISNNSKGFNPEDVCRADCPVASLNKLNCSKDTCNVPDGVSVIPCSAKVDCTKTCISLSQKPLKSQQDSDIEINLGDIDNPCCIKSCDVADKVKDFIVDSALQGKKTTVNENDPCYCDCECKFGFNKMTTYCAVCGGYEVAGADMNDKAPYEMAAPPCPIYHKLYDKNKFKLNSTWNDEPKASLSETRRGSSRGAKVNDTSSKTTTIGLGQTSTKEADGGDKKSADKKPQPKKELTIEGQSEKKTTKEKKKVGKFTFNYGYKGIAPQIGHSRCHLPYNAKIGNTGVPRNMGWLWTAEDVPGMKYRPDWRPGAANKHVVNLLRNQKNPEIALKKKRQREIKLKPKLEKKPLLKIHKKDGEYSVTMETMKIYPKPRTINQYPFEDKAPETFFIGRTDEENARREKRLQREKRRKDRAARQYIQQNFKNMCEEICMNTYRQAIGTLKTVESPECPCYPQYPDVISLDVDGSCSCSDTYSSSGSETDDDEWMLEFTPPVATYDPKFKPSPIKHSTASQYNYLDFKVKLVGKDGNAVPRYFKGPDGKMMCSDLGGFFSPTGEWLEIGVDGYVGPDGRWVPNTFIGPDGQIIDSSSGKFQGPDGEWLTIGVDGYIDANGQWVYDPPRPSPPSQSWPRKTPSDSTWSCFGEIAPEILAERGIVCHSRDRKLLRERLKNMIKLGKDIKIPTPSVVPKSPYRPKTPPKKRNWAELYKCKHPTPPTKGYSIDSEGNIKYFTIGSKKYNKASDRMKSLNDQGIGMCDYHLPCLDSLIGCKEFKKLHGKKLRGRGAGKEKRQNRANDVHLYDI